MSSVADVLAKIDLLAEHDGFGRMLDFEHASGQVETSPTCKCGAFLGKVPTMDSHIAEILEAHMRDQVTAAYNDAAEIVRGRLLEIEQARVWAYATAELPTVEEAIRARATASPADLEAQS